MSVKAEKAKPAVPVMGSPFENAAAAPAHTCRRALLAGGTAATVMSFRRQ
ncbi:hypothetical protein [Streptomyces montanisoli]|uniref:Uncharacterized protein n=1 Tax=Streptomyces montanisoli TaxID=2798581 RepID=A0A940RSR6_9ACTN|nr:hypothetical protein [Streptomyces montanisoli]MBP0456052.1 hypothetical protein [Streptomyces montanisoli]